MLTSENLTKTYQSGQKTALNHFSINIPKHSIYGLLGPNGAGKTTFIRIVNQILQPDSGTVRINGEILAPNHIKKIGYMPEERGLYKNMKVGEQLLYFGSLKGMKKGEVLGAAKIWFDRLHIEHWWEKKLSDLSKGMAQKIQFVITVIHQPELLILDEPFSGFDPINANLIKEQLIRMKQEGTTIMLSTHRMESVEEMCDYVALVNYSKKILDGKTMEVRESFKQNMYSIGLKVQDELAFKTFIQANEPISVIQKENYYAFEMKAVSSQKNLLLKLMELGEIIEFSEKIPSMNEVFISAVSGEFQK